MQQAPSTSNVRAQILVGLVGGIAAVVTLLLGPLELSVFVGVLLLASYYDFRRLLAAEGHPSTLVLGGIGVVAFAWSGYEGTLELVPATVAGLILVLLVTRIALNEAGSRVEGVTGDIASTLGAAALVGVLGAHVLLTRAVPFVGFRGLLAFGLLVVSSDISASVVGRLRGRHVLNRLLAPHKTWEGAAAGIAASVVTGLVIGLTLGPPFDARSGPLFGAGAGVLAVLGDLAFAAVKRSAGMRRPAAYLRGAGGALDAVDSALFVAPAFYWAFRTIAL